MVKDRNHQSNIARGYKNVNKNINRSSDRINCNNHNYYVHITIDNTSEPVAEDMFSAIRELQEQNIDLVVKRLDKIEDRQLQQYTSMEKQLRELQGTLNETLLTQNVELQRELYTLMTKRYEELENSHVAALENIEKLNRDLTIQQENSVLMEKKIEELQMALSEAQENIAMLNLRNVSNDHGIEDTTVVVPRKEAEKKKSKAKNERNLDTDDSTSSQLTSSSNALSDSEVPVANSHENSAVITSQKKAVKKCKRAKNQHKQATSDSTTSNSNTHAEEVSGESNMDIIPASLPRFNQFPRFQSGSEDSAFNSFPRWFIFLLVLLRNLNPSNIQITNNINCTDNSRRSRTDNLRKIRNNTRSFQFSYDQGRNISTTKGNVRNKDRIELNKMTKKTTGAQENLEWSDLD